MLRIIMNLIAETPEEVELEAYAAAGSILDRPQIFGSSIPW